MNEWRMNEWRRNEDHDSRTSAKKMALTMTVGINNHICKYNEWARINVKSNKICFPAQYIIQILAFIFICEIYSLYIKIFLVWVNALMDIGKTGETAKQYLVNRKVWTKLSIGDISQDRNVLFICISLFDETSYDAHATIIIQLFD